MVRFGVIASVFFVALGPVTTSGQSLVGEWTLQERVINGGPNGGTVTVSQPSLRIFTDTHFSRMFVWPGDGPRPEASGFPDVSDADWRAVMTSIRANSGTYELDGTTLTEHRLLAMNPVAMGQSGTFEVRLEGDTLWLTGENADGTVTTTERWLRVETGDEAAVNARVDGYYRALRAGDLEPYINVYHANALRAIGGGVLVGRDSIRSSASTAFETNGGVAITFNRHETILLSSTAAVVHGSFELESGPTGQTTITLVKEGGEWLIAALQNGPAPAAR